MKITKAKSKVNTVIKYFLISFIFISLFNFIIDPFGIFVFYVKNINAIKNNTLNDRIPKFYFLKNNYNKYQTIIMGSSRTEVLNPNDLNIYISKKLGNIYNFSLYGSSVFEQSKYLEWIIKNNTNLKFIFWGVDFFSLNEFKIHDLNKSQYSEDRFIQKFYFKDYQDSLVTFTALKSSIYTYFDNLIEVYPKQNYFLGYNTYLDLKEKEFSYIENRIDNSYYIYAIDKTLFGSNEIRNYSLLKMQLKNVKYIVNLCKNNNIKLFIFVPPVYTEFLDFIYWYGLGLYFEFFKKELVKISDYYDFSFNAILNRDKKNWYDAVHMKSEKFANFFEMVAKEDNNYLISKTNIKAKIKLQRLSLECFKYKKYFKNKLHLINKKFIVKEYGCVE